MLSDFLFILYASVVGGSLLILIGLILWLNIQLYRMGKRVDGFEKTIHDIQWKLK